MTTDQWIEAIIDHVPPAVNVTVWLRGRGGNQLLTMETAADVAAAKAVARAHGKKFGISDQYISFQERNRHRLKKMK